MAALADVDASGRGEPDVVTVAVDVLAGPSGTAYPSSTASTTAG